MIEDKKFYSICRLAHVMLACLMVVLPFLFFGWQGMGVGTAVIVSWAAGKEIWDEYNEEPAERGNGWEDFFEYAAGVGIGLALCGLKIYLG